MRNIFLITQKKEHRLFDPYSPDYPQQKLQEKPTGEKNMNKILKHIGELFVIGLIGLCFSLTILGIVSIWKAILE